MRRQPCFEKYAFVKLTLVFDIKNQPTQTKVIPFSKSTLKKKGNTEQDTFLILLTLAVNI